MKRIVVILMLVVTITYANSSLQLRIGGMTCGGCASGINESFEEDLPKYKVHVDFETAVMHIETKDDSDIDIKEVQDALEDMGFKGSII